VQKKSIGYARITTQDQDLSLQLNDLKKLAAEKYFLTRSAEQNLKELD